MPKRIKVKIKNRQRERQLSKAEKETAKAATFAAVTQGLYWLVKIIRELLETKE